MTCIREISTSELDQITGAQAWYVSAAAHVLGAGSGHALAGAYSFVKLGWDSAHGRAENADS